MNFLKKAVTTLSVIASVLFLTAVPASAHTLDQAVRAGAGCGWTSGSYTTLHSAGARNSASGINYGTVYLLWSSTYQENCVVTLKTGPAHGVESRTTAYLMLQSPNETVGDDDNYAHYAAVSYPARGRCVAYIGSMYLPGVGLASGGRITYGNCG
ncbi:hypothetical protein [Nocardiopsis dassonvillei]|uniref:hypothetical protein n=1 Tax=Nocardiopsis dassonvillei TaxID=2014 RepID=UPI00157E0FE5|nr:hypothetical protein [Nocardiopsis dassonvillei]